MEQVDGPLGSYLLKICFVISQAREAKRKRDYEK
jgi:hypothetical protein